MEYLIKQYPLETGALEIQYIEEYFGEFPRKKLATELVSRLRNREYLILMAEAPLRDDPGTIVRARLRNVGPRAGCLQRWLQTGRARLYSTRTPTGRRRRCGRQSIVPVDGRAIGGGSACPDVWSAEHESFPG